MVWSNDEYQGKLRRIRELLNNEQTDYLLLSNQLNIMWLTGGRSYVNKAADKACADILIGRDQVFLVSNNIESERLLKEELVGLNLASATYNWWDKQGLENALRNIVGSGRMVHEAELGAKMARLRWALLPEEQARYAETGRDIADILEFTAFCVTPGMSEMEISCLMQQKAAALGVNPWITLVAADERGYRYRHFLPTENKLQNYLMLSMTAEKYGLYASATRLVHFGPVSSDLCKRYEAVTSIDTAYIASTVPGASVAKIFTQAVDDYKTTGYAGEWMNHHQGGMIGYQPREYRVTTESCETVAQGQAYAWNPTIAGVKSEDTILVSSAGPVILTKPDKFPVKEFVHHELVINRPAILVR